MLSFITLMATDIEKTADVYRALGVEFVRERHGNGPWHLASENADLVIEIYERASVSCEGILLGFDVADLDLTRDQLLNSDAEIKKGIEIVDGLRRLMVSDPEGRQIYVRERPSEAHH